MQGLNILVNPRAGGGRGARMAAAIEQWAEAAGPQHRVQVAEGVPAALAWLRALPEGARVALVGGDGTVNQMLPALLERRLQLGLVPLGSGNDCARAFGLAGLSWRAALAWAQEAAPLATDVGWLEGPQLQHPFLSSLTVGFDSAVGYRALVGPRWLRGLPRYLLATLRELAALQTWDMEVTLDDLPLHRGATLFASSLNTPSYGSGMPAAPGARIDDGMLDAVVAGDFGALQALAMLPRLLAGRHLGHPRVQLRRFARLQIRSAQALPLAADGEWLGHARELSVHVAPGALQVLRRAPPAAPTKRAEPMARAQ